MAVTMRIVAALLVIAAVWGGKYVVSPHLSRRRGPGRRGYRSAARRSVDRLPGATRDRHRHPHQLPSRDRCHPRRQDSGPLR